MNSLIDNRNRILEEARNTDTITLTTNGKGDLVYEEANDTFPSVPPIKRASKGSLAKILVDCWMTTKKITSLENLKQTRSFDIGLFIGTMESIEELANDHVNQAKECTTVLKSIPLPPSESRRMYNKGGATKPNASFKECIK